MTLCAGHLRKEDELISALDGAEKLYKDIECGGYPAKYAAHGLMNRQLAFAHYGYLSAILFQLRSGSGSRGSAAVLDENGKIVPECIEFRKKILESFWDGGKFIHQWVNCRPLPSCDGWFETVWADHRTGNVYDKVLEQK